MHLAESFFGRPKNTHSLTSWGHSLQFSDPSLEPIPSPFARVRVRHSRLRGRGESGCYSRVCMYGVIFKVHVSLSRHHHVAIVNATSKFCTHTCVTAVVESATVYAYEGWQLHTPAGHACPAASRHLCTGVTETTNLPGEIKRQLSQLRDLDTHAQASA
eukprot:861518-Pleurochrysis_carterae.AAC.2